MAYFISADVDENKCVEEATRRFHSTGKKSWVHHHKYQQPCNEECYLAPRKLKKEKETQNAFN